MVKKKILVVGGGAAGMACAWSLSRTPDRFEVHVWEASAVPGGVASSCRVTVAGGVELDINDQVQGGAPSYRHNMRLLDTFGFKPTPVNMRIAFGKGERQWTNHSPSPLTERLGPEIARFGELLNTITRWEPLFVVLPIARVLRWNGFSTEFANEMVFPLVALFFGTGNQTPNVSAAIIARVFTDPDLRLFDYCPERLLNSVPEMFAFPKLADVWATVAKDSPFTLHTNRAAASVQRSSHGIVATDAAGKAESFDELVFASDAETVLRVLGKDATWLERRILGNVEYFNDFAITHQDEEYMRVNHDMRAGQGDNYFVATYPSAPHKIEMSFNLSTYQPHLRQQAITKLSAKQDTGGMCTSHGVGDELTGDVAAHVSGPPGVDSEHNRLNAPAGSTGDIYQTYYLDDRNKGLWTDKQVNPAKILTSRWMRQFAHTWRHFAFFVPWARLIQGSRHTYYCGSWLLVNTQEVAVVSGLAAAFRLGAEYPFADDPLAASQFDTFLAVAHGACRKVIY